MQKKVINFRLNLFNLSKQFCKTSVVRLRNMDEQAAKRKKVDETEKVLQQIENNELEEVDWNGRSPAWTQFVKLRDKSTNAFINHVQCKGCKILRLYNRKNGTSSLKNHKCHDKESEKTVFQEISAEVAAELKTILTQNLMELCAEDVISVNTVGGSGFLRFVQNLASLVEKHGNVDFQKIFPNTPAIDQCIQSAKNKQQLEVADDFEKALLKNWCSLSMNTWQSDINEKQLLLIVSVTYFKDDLTTLAKKVLFTAQVPQNYEKLMSDIRKKLRKLGCDEMKLREVYMVTPREDMFVQTLQSQSKRENCVAFTISSILKTSFKCTGNNISEILFNCKEIVRYIIETEKNTKLKFKVVQEVETWKSKVEMMSSVTCQYDDVVNLLNAGGKHELRFNKSIAEELAQVLQVFAEAIQDLQSTTYTTINKVLPWYAILLDHLNSTDEYSIEMKLFMQQTKSILTTQFIPNMNQKVGCFLDPRYRKLKMLSESERTEVIDEIQFILKNMSTEQLPINNVPELDKKKSKFSRFEANDEDIGEKDEVNIYIHSTQLKDFNFDEEFNIIGQFWKNNENKLPKLFKLATARLILPACCCGGCKPLSRPAVPLDQFNDLILARGNLPRIK